MISYIVKVDANIDGVVQTYTSHHALSSMDLAEKCLGGTVIEIFNAYPQAVIIRAYIIPKESDL